MPTAIMTPKAVIHQQYDAKAVYRVDEAREAVDGICPASRCHRAPSASTAASSTSPGCSASPPRGPSPGRRRPSRPPHRSPSKSLVFSPHQISLIHLKKLGRNLFVGYLAFLQM
uniref:Uncharacterized protein n=1 Tax=Triticum urartu TaxID=4572 RepID=A0A8R7PAW2_TRIUA